MTKTNKILLSSITTLALLLNGCGDGGTEAGDPVSENPVVPIAVTPDPVVPTEPVPVVDPYKTAGWYGKTQVSATDSNGEIYRHTSAGVFGELVQSDDAKDQHDIPAMGSSIFKVIFPQADWADEDNGEYFSDYRQYDPDSTEKQVWTFQVKNEEIVDLSNAPISIGLQGIFDVQYKEENGKVTYKESTDVNQTILNNLHLVDVDNARDYTVGELQTANLTMDGVHTRTFRWVLGSVDSSDYTALAKTTSTQTAKSTESSDEDGFTETTKTTGTFGLPPQ